VKYFSWGELEIVLKTIIPSRKATGDYLRSNRDEES
jgi:hypothetical protein